MNGAGADGAAFEAKHFFFPKMPKKQAIRTYKYMCVTLILQTTESLAMKMRAHTNVHSYPIEIKTV